MPDDLPETDFFSLAHIQRRATASRSSGHMAFGEPRGLPRYNMLQS